MMILAPAPKFGSRCRQLQSVATWQLLESGEGLKLEPAKGPVERFVIDHIERPARN
jgi:uncharacterized protein (TIGR03435 family)